LKIRIHETVKLPVVSYERRTYITNVGTKVIREIFGPRKDEVPEQFGILHNENGYRISVIKPFENTTWKNREIKG
jgi:hypothetical protein